jgi:hypothetical protein
LDGLDESGDQVSVIEEKIADLYSSNTRGIVLSSRICKSDINEVKSFINFKPCKILPLSLELQMKIGEKRGLKNENFLLNDENYKGIILFQFRVM